MSAQRTIKNILTIQNELTFILGKSKLTKCGIIEVRRVTIFFTQLFQLNIYCIHSIASNLKGVKLIF